MIPEMLTAGAIASLAFDAVIKTGVGEITKDLWAKIKERFKGEETVETAILKAEETQSIEVLETQVVPFLQVEMLKDKDFERELQQMVLQIKQQKNESQDNITMTGTSQDQSTFKQVGEININADTVNF